MIKEFLVMRTRLYYENRIALLKSRTTKDNGRIIAKLERKLRQIDE